MRAIITRILRSTGAFLLGILVGLLKVLRWISELKVVLYPVAAFAGVAAAILAILFGMQWGRFAPVMVPPSPQEIISTENLRALGLEMSDTGDTDKQRTYALFANMNTAKKTGLSNMSVYEKCLIVLAPTQQRSVCSMFRAVPVAEQAAKLLENPELAASIVLRDEIVKNPEAYVARHPELPGLVCVDFINRSKERAFRWSGTDKQAMRNAFGPPVFREVMPDGSVFEAFCSSLKPKASSLWPPWGVPPLGVLFYIDSALKSAGRFAYHASISGAGRRPLCA